MQDGTMAFLIEKKTLLMTLGNSIAYGVVHPLHQGLKRVERRERTETVQRSRLRGGEEDNEISCDGQLSSPFL